MLATGGAEKKLRIFDLTRGGSSSTGSTPPIPSSATPATENGVASYEIGAGVHGGTIKSIVWNQDYNVVTTAAEDRKIRWWDLRSRHPIVEYGVDGTIGSCELNSLATRPNDAGILTVAAGKSVYLFDGVQPGRLLKKVDYDYDVASAAVNSESGRLVTGSANDTWARVYDLNTDEELGMFCYFWWCVFWRRSRANFLPQRFKRVTMALSGPSASPPMASSTGLVARTVLSSCGKHAANPTGCGDELDTFIIVTVYRKNHGRMSYILPLSFAILVLFIIGGFHWIYDLSICILSSSIGCTQPLVLYAGFMACVHLF